jgi:hypothetical protein
MKPSVSEGLMVGQLAPTSRPVPMNYLVGRYTLPKVSEQRDRAANHGCYR